MKGLTLSAKEQNRLQILNGVMERHWSMAKAAQLMGVSERHGWRLLAAYRKEGAAGLAHKNRGRTPSNATPVQTKDLVVSLAQGRYKDVNHTHLSELLAEREGVKLSRPTLRRILVRSGLKSPRRGRRPKHRYRRQRMPQEGMLLQLDGSHHRWLEDRGPRLTLLLAIDDATGTAPHALFSQVEDTRGYLSLLQGVIEAKGIPLAVYTDGHAVFANRLDFQDTVWEGKEGKLTQCSRALGELGITRIGAHSPEAKGRVERANGTFQDRLVSELRLAGACTLSEANDVLAAFLPRFNRRFGVPANQPQSAYRPLGEEVDLAGVLCFKEQRRVARDNTVQYKNKTLQLFPGTDRTSYAGSRVEVQERLDGRILVKCGKEVLTPQEAPPLAAELRSYINAPPVVPYVLDPIPERTRVPKPLGPLAGETIWYEDPDRKQTHRDLVLAGMERARRSGKRIGRPKLSDMPGFEENFKEVAELIEEGTLSRRKASLKLGIGYATLKRMLDARASSGS
ncbi:MAG: ISNCY family transposase [Chloroflexi bacterium]|nr:ISNCY family transposase [Chloroflexota bacterium]